MITHRRRVLSTSILAAFVGLLASRPAGAASPQDARIKVAVGEEFTITLDSNVSTGFGWQLAKPLAEAVVKAVKNVYENPQQPARSRPIPGADGKEVWTFKGVGSGKTTIEFKYTRPWEKDVAPAKTASYRVVVMAPEKK